MIWVIKDDSIGNAYLDKGAAMFFLEDHNMDSCIDDQNVAGHLETRNTQNSCQKNSNAGYFTFY